jgi:S-adenosylmethionine synthetase
VIVAEFGVAAAEFVTATFVVVDPEKSAAVEYSISYCVTALVWLVSAVQERVALSAVLFASA